MAKYVDGYPEDEVTLDPECEDIDVPLIPTTHDKLTKIRCLYQQPGGGFTNISNDANEAKRKIMLTMVLCVIFMATESIGGYLSGSLAIMVDAAHLLSDCISFIVGLVAIWVSNKPPDKRLSFGYKRIEVMGAIISVLGIWALTAILFYEAIDRIITDDFIIQADLMMVIAGIGIAINITMVLVLHGSLDFGKFGAHGHSHFHPEHGPELSSHLHLNLEPTSLTPNEGNGGLQSHDNFLVSSNRNVEFEQNGFVATNGTTSHAQGAQRKKQNINIRAAIIHVVGDLIQSIGVFIASIIIKINPNAKLADPVCTLLFSFIVILTTYQIIRQSLIVVMDAVPDGISLTQIENDLNNLEGVKGVHNLHVWSHSLDFHVMMAHLIADETVDHNSILKSAIMLARNKYQMKHVTFQIEKFRVETR